MRPTPAETITQIRRLLKDVIEPDLQSDYARSPDEPICPDRRAGRSCQRSAVAVVTDVHLHHRPRTCRGRRLPGRLVLSLPTSVPARPRRPAYRPLTTGLAPLGAGLNHFARCGRAQTRVELEIDTDGLPGRSRAGRAPGGV
jgi:hypothetical protein